MKKMNFSSVALRRRAASGAISLVRALFLLGLCYLFLFPIFYLLLSTVATPESFLNPNVVWIPTGFTWENIVAAATKIQFFEAAGLSLQNTVLGTAVSLISCALVGYGFARYEFAEKKIMFLLVILTIIIPPQTMLISQFLQYKAFDFGGILGLFGVNLNLLSTSWVFVLPAIFACGLRNGLYIFIFRQFFLGMPKDLEEAAWVDGCNPLMTFVRIIVPSAGNGIITVTLFSFVWHWNDYYYSQMLYTSQLKPLIPMMYMARSNLVSQADRGELAFDARGVMCAAGILTLIVPMTLYIVLQRYFVESIERTGIVG